MGDSKSVCIACINSPLNCTLSGPEAAIDAVKAQADKDSIFAQKLKTGVAYHSPSMRAIADEYLRLMGDLKTAGTTPRDLKTAAGIPMVSSVTGKVLRPITGVTKGQYWVENMVSTVRFADAVQVLTQETSKLKVGMGSITDLIEVGPHPALKRSVQDTVGQSGNRRKQIRYATALHRSHPALQTTLELVGQLFCLGHSIDFSAVNREEDAVSDGHCPFLVDCPKYPFDKSNTYWAESRVSRDYRLRGAVIGEMIGVRTSDWNPLEPRWRNFLCLETVPWISHHKISDTVLYPASGMLIMAIEAVQQMVPAGHTVAGYRVERVDFSNPIIVQDTWDERVETQVHLRSVRRPNADSAADDASLFETVIFAYARGEWIECSRATIEIQYEEATSNFDGIDERRLADDRLRSKHSQAKEHCSHPIDSYVFYRDAAEQGLQYGDFFQLLQDVRWDGKSRTVAHVDVSKPKFRTSSLVHPAILDQAFHVLRISASQQSAANVPIRLSDAWISAKGWQAPETSTIQWLATSTALSNVAGGGEQGMLHAFADDGSVLCSIGKAVTAAVSKKTKTPKDKKLLYSVEWKPQLSLLSPEQLALACDAGTSAQDETEILAHHDKLCTALELAAAKTLKTIDLSRVPNGLCRHVEWMNRHVGKLSPAQKQEVEVLSDAEVEARLSEVDRVLPSWKIYTTCARKLPEMLSGKTDPLQVVFESDQANIFYADLFQRLCADGRLGSILDLAAHENPALRILEVGAGTGGMTGHVIAALQDREARTGGLSFSEYSYTDISPAFFEKARTRWPDLDAQGRISFKTLDLDRSIDTQGFEPGSYDLIVAASVMHATPYLEATIRNVKKALKPGGKLLLLEVVNPDDIATNFMAGLVPGWWVAREEWRPHSAAVPEDLWDWCLKKNGFSGNDVVIRDYEMEECHIMSIIITTALDDDKTAIAPEPAHESTSRIVLVHTEPSEQGPETARLLKEELDASGMGQVSTCSFTLDSLAKELADLSKDDIVVCLAEVLDKPLLSNLSENSFKCLQHLIKNSPILLWSVATTIDDPCYPDYGVVQGFLRSIRAEQADHHIVNVSIEGETDVGKCVNFISQVLRASFGQSASKELEYVVRNGMLHTGRAVENVSGNDTLRPLLFQQPQQVSWGEAEALRLEVGTRGMLDSLRFVPDDTHQSDLGPDDVEIEARAWSLTDRDLHAAMGRLDSSANESALGLDCVGVVARRGSGADPAIKIGDHVCMVAQGCLRKYPRANKAHIVKIPDTLPFETALSVVVPGMTAYHSLIDVARLEHGDKVLIHSAASSVGQIAILLAQDMGTTVYCTVSSPEEQTAVLEHLRMPADHIFQSTSFAKGVLRATKNEGVDVVINSLSGDAATRASYECIASGGRFVEIERSNVDADAAVTMGMLSRNISLSVVDVMNLKPSTIRRLLRKTVELLDNDKIQVTKPMELFDASMIGNAFLTLRDGHVSGRVVIKANRDDVIDVSLPPVCPSPLLSVVRAYATTMQNAVQ